MPLRCLYSVTAFFAVVSIGVIGLYWCFAIPIWKRLKMGSSFSPGTWNLGKHYRWIAVLALADVVLVTGSRLSDFASASRRAISALRSERMP